MRLHWADLDRYRNLERQKVNLHPRYNLFVGNNGQGKTNFLEAIGYLGTLKSFRSASRTDIIRHGSDLCRISSELSSGGVIRNLAFALSRRGRSQFLDDRKVSSPEEYLSAVALISFIPEDVGLISGPPSLRRRTVDRAVFEIRLPYIDEYRRYLRVLRNRNALLRKGAADRDELDSWTRSLIRDGAVLISRRLELMSAINRHLGPTTRKLGLDGEAALAYFPSFGPPPDDQGPDEKGDLILSPGLDIEGSFSEAVRAVRGREIRARHSLIGPHRDNVLFMMDGRNMARFGSQGQKRVSVLAFKLALARVIRQRKGFWPVILLDDVASELDQARRRSLGHLIRDMDAQFMVTTTSEEPGFLDRKEGYIFSVKQGKITRLT